ncbi:DUF1403 family protein [Nereida sp. MMG025]|uniref:DUF1403 family protein n=1 Tax=Nereida sp. MMG025 TaxID=2909981 RepID=UPI001F3D86CF|nr:DUF1403 family protein [Nereida sp. MMG025]MCF6445673.1 DUF1403 family protein [Nereida sp. MMG025]
MTYASDSFDTLPRMPAWVMARRAETLEDVAFLSGAALSHLHIVLNQQSVPQALLRQRLALRAAEACVTHQGRPERSAEMRDAMAFLQPGDNPGPAGEIYLSWHRAVERPVMVKVLHRALPEATAEQIAMWLDGCDPRAGGQGEPIARAAAILEAVLADRPRGYATALVLADAALAQALGWTHVTPLLGPGVKRTDLRKTGEELRFACHWAIRTAATEATRGATDLSRRAARLRTVAPKLRAKGADEAVSRFLNCDAVAPTVLTSLRSDRAARRFCDRLVALGAVRELTGRDTFRLYGV